MSLASRVAALATRIAAEFRASEIDLASSIAEGFVGTLKLRRRGSTMAEVRGTISRASGIPLGASTSQTVIATIPLEYAPDALALSASRTNYSSGGYAGGTVRLDSAGRITLAGHRDADTQVSFGMTYLL